MECCVARGALDDNERAISFSERHGGNLTSRRFESEMVGIHLTDVEMSTDLSADVLTHNRNDRRIQVGVSAVGG